MNIFILRLRAMIFFFWFFMPLAAMGSEGYIPHVTGNGGFWKTFLQVDNNGAAEASFTITLYDNGRQVYEGEFSVSGFGEAVINLRDLAAFESGTGRVASENDHLNFRINYESMPAGGLAEFFLSDDKYANLGFYFTDYTPSLAWKAIALNNPNDAAAVVTLYAVGSGRILGETSFSMGAQTKTDGICTKWFPDVTLEEIERIVATSDALLTGITISGNADNSLMLFTPASGNVAPPTQPPTATGEATVLAVNDLGMHCMDQEYSVFSILPPFNVVHAQVVMRDAAGRPYLTDSVEVFYDAVSDAAGSKNSFSTGKTAFWEYAEALFGIPLMAGEGLTGLYMPGDNPQIPGPQPMAFNSGHGWFSADGIPMTPMDDNLGTNPYPLMRIVARQGVQELGRLDVVVPVATETDCRNCHKTGAIAASDPGVSWSVDADLEVQSKLNVLKLHDLEHPQYALEASQPVLCARCHYSPALDLGGTGPAGDQIGKPNFSGVMHAFHGGLESGGAPVFPPNAPVDDTCYQCHPGKVTQCQRGAMRTGGMDCNDCHGDMLAVGGAFPLQAGGSIDGRNDGNARRPWTDLPRCQSCHTGDALNHLTGADLVNDANWPFRLRQAYRTGDASASPLLADNNRFAENLNTLYRFSKGHGGVMCEGCHGSTHAVWPNAASGANDNVAAAMLQGYAGTIIECGTCHKQGSLALTVGGPHGLHNVNDARWYDGGHEDFYERSPDTCRSCHGANLTGTPLAKMPTARSFRVEGRTVAYAMGDLVRCDRCHEMPDEEED